MSEQLTRRQQAAAWHGLATNGAYPPTERLQLALQALNLYEAELVERHNMSGGSWRIVITDSESETGVAPICDSPVGHNPRDLVVMDCCRGPHIECWSEGSAERVAEVLNEVEAEICS